MAEEVGADFINVEVICSGKEELRSRVENRGPSLSGLTLPVWREVLARDYHSWTEDRIQLDSAGKTAEECLSELLLAIRDKGFIK